MDRQQVHSIHHRMLSQQEHFCHSRNYLLFQVYKLLRPSSQGNPLEEILPGDQASCKLHSCIHCLVRSIHCSTCSQSQEHLHSSTFLNFQFSLFFPSRYFSWLFYLSQTRLVPLLLPSLFLLLKYSELLCQKEKSACSNEVLLCVSKTLPSLLKICIPHHCHCTGIFCLGIF